MNLKQIAQKLGGYIQSKTQDDEGWVRQNKFTPVQQVQQIGQNIGQTKLPSGRTLSQLPNDYMQSFSQSRSLPEKLMNIGTSSFLKNSTFGLLQPQAPKAETGLEKFYSGLGGLTGFVGPGSAGMKAMTGIDKLGQAGIMKFAPKLQTTLAGKIAGGLGKEAAQTGAYMTGKYLAGKAGLKPDEKITGKSILKDLAIGAAMRGITTPGALGTVRKMISPDVWTSDRNTLNEALQRLKVGETIDEFSETGKAIKNMYKEYGLASYPNWNKLSQSQQVNLLSERLDEMARSGFNIKMGIYGGKGAQGYKPDMKGQFSNMADKKVRFEIDDSKAKYNFDSLMDLNDIAKRKGKIVTVKDLIQHDELFKQYPEIKNMKVDISSGDGVASYHPETDSIRFYPNPVMGSPKSIQSTLLHEIQHAIQTKEGFAKGGNPEGMSMLYKQWNDSSSAYTLRREMDKLPKNIDLNEKVNIVNQKYKELLGDNFSDEAVKLAISKNQDEILTLNKGLEKYHYNGGIKGYQRLSGEIESRDVSARKDLTPEQRARTMPYVSQGIPQNEWITKFDDNTSLSSPIKTGGNVSQISPESVSKVENKLPPHLQKIVDKQNAIKPDFTIEEFTPKGFEQSNIETPPRLFEKLPNETGDMARARMVGYQIDNGKVKLTNTPSGWEARISDVGGENLVKSGYQNKQQLINDVYETLNPDIVYPKNLSPESKGIKITETPKIKLKTIPLEQPTGPELKQRGFSASVQEAPNVSKKVKQEVLGGYETKPNDQLMGEAKALLTEGGQIDFKNTKDIDKKVAATIQEALNQQKAGNHKAAADLFNNLSEQGTELGRGVQAFSLLKNMSPEAIALSAAGKIKKYNQTAKAKIPELTGEQVKAISDKVAEADLLKGEARNKALFEINKMINEYIPSSLSDKALTVWKAGLLTSFRTHIRNFVGNTIHGVSETAKDIPATIADIGLSAKTGKRTITPTIKGTSEAWSKDTVEQMRSILGSGYDPDKIIEKFDTKQITWGKNLVEKGLKAYTDTVFRLLGASDKPFYNAAMARSLYSQAGAEAINQGVRGNKAFIDNLVKNPTEDMLKIAIGDANVATFKDRNKAVEIASALKRSMSTTKAGKVISEITMPFTGVPGSVLGQIISYSPAGLIKGSIDAGRVSLGNMPELQRQAAQEIGRGVIGTGIFGLGSYLMSKGLMTGQPKDQEEQRQWELENKPRNSIMIGGKWRSLNSIGPEAVVFLAGSKLNEELNSEEGNLGTYAVKLGKDYLDQSFVQGLQGPVNAITDPNRYAKSYVGNQLSSVVPNIVKDISKATDPYQREANTVMDYAKQGIPGARQTLTERRDVLGNIIPQEPTGGAAFVDIFNSKTPIKNDVVGELSRLNEAGYNATPSKLQVTQTIKGVKGKLTQQQLDVLETKSGLATSTAIDKLIKTSGYQKLNDEDKQKAIDDLVTKTRKQVRSTIDLSVMPDMGYTTSEDSPKGLGRVGLYGKSLVTDPGQTLKAVIAGNPIRKVEGGAVILERKNALGTLDAGDKTTEVDHIIALTLGGTNDKSNLQILTKEENRIKGQIETYLYNEMKAGRITKKEAQERDKNWKDEIDNLPQATKEKLVTELSTDTSDTGTTGDTYQIINEDTGNITTIDLSKPIEEPEYTGFDELDKKLKSSYKSAITTRISNITKLYKDGQITAEKANKLISELKTKSGTGTKKKSKKKITFKVTSPKALPKITLKISSPVSRVKLKSAPKIKLSKTDNRKYTIKA